MGLFFCPVFRVLWSFRRVFWSECKWINECRIGESCFSLREKSEKIESFSRSKKQLSNFTKTKLGYPVPLTATARPRSENILLWRHFCS